MEKSIWNFLVDINSIDIQDTKERFLENESFFKSCLEKCLFDSEFENLKVSLQKQDVSSAFESAHSLKGMTSNCGLTSLYDILLKITEPLRHGDCDGLLAYYDLLEKELKRIRDIFSTY